MKQAAICKTSGSLDVTDEQLEKINQYTRRALTRDEVFVFSVILCDNEIDRDLERFPHASLEALGELYRGKTGVFDHAPTAENQSARIFDTRLEQSDRVNSVGEACCSLKAWAYMVRCVKNADLILEIDAGIKKEVSVGCAVESVLCSVCGEDQKTSPCDHRKGQVYDGRLCHHLLVNPTDAYEWSFVAVPAQKNAGVTKRRREMDSAPDTAAMIRVDKAKLARLERLAARGKRYEAELRKSVVRLGLLGQPDLPADTLEAITARLDIPQLEALQKSFGRAARAAFPLTPQLAPRKGEAEPENEFLI